MKFNTAYKQEYKVDTLPIGKRITDTTGYISPNIRIESMIAAGEKLVEFRDDQAQILEEIYADERALPYNPSELQMLEINSLTSKSAIRAIERMQAYQKAMAQAQAEANAMAGPPDATTGKNSGTPESTKQPENPDKK